MKALQSVLALGNHINLILDVSGSVMCEHPENVQFARQIAALGTTLNLILLEHEVRSISVVTSTEAFDAALTGNFGGGTNLQRGVDAVVKQFNSHPTVIVTDRFVDRLDCSYLEQETLIVTNDPKFVYKHVYKYAENKVDTIALD